MKKAICTALIAVILVGLFPTITAVANPWPAFDAQNRHMDGNNHNLAVPYWRRLLEYWRNSNDAGEVHNAALMAMRLADFHAGEFSTSVFNAEAAVRYYEQAGVLYRRASAMGFSDLGWAIQLSDVQANRFRTDIRVFVERPIGERPARNRPLALHEPANGMIAGIFGTDPAFFDGFYPSPTLLNSVTGVRHSSFLAYAYWGQPFRTRFAEEVQSLGASLQIAWEPRGGLREVQDGPYLRQWARDAAATGMPIFLRFAGEMNGDWVSWYDDPALYIEKFRLVSRVMRQEAPNVAMVWAPNDWPFDNYMDFFPGDTYVDWVGVSSYLTIQANRANADAWNADWYNCPIFKLSHIVEMFGSRFPIMIVETAAGYTARHQNDEDITDWAINGLEMFYLYAKRVFPEIRAIFYFSEITNQGRYRLTENNRVMEAYRRIMSSNYFLRTMADSVPFFYRPVEEGNFHLEPDVRLSAYVNTYDYRNSRVVFSFRNVATGQVTPIGESTFIPFVVTHDFSGFAPGAYYLIVRAYDSRGAHAGTREIRINAVSGTGGQAAPTPTPPAGPSSWAQPYVDDATAMGFLPAAFTVNYQGTTTRAEFAALAVYIYEKLHGPIAGRQTFNDTDDVNVQKAAYIGVVMGTGEGNFTPNRNLSRQEAAVMLSRLADILSQPLPTLSPTFGDNAAAYAWALDAMGQMQATGIMGGVGEGNFDPAGSYTREQSIITAVRLIRILA